LAGHPVVALLIIGWNTTLITKEDMDSGPINRVPERLIGKNLEGGFCLRPPGKGDTKATVGSNRPCRRRNKATRPSARHRLWIVEDQDIVRQSHCVRLVNLSLLKAALVYHVCGPDKGIGRVRNHRWGGPGRSPGEMERLVPCHCMRFGPSWRQHCE